MTDNRNKQLMALKTLASEHDTTKNTLLKYKNAKNAAQSVLHPNRYAWLELIYDIRHDAHLFNLVKIRKAAITGLDFSLTKANGNIDDKTTLLFEGVWFKKFLNYALDAIFYGNSLIEFFIDSKGELDCELIPRENVIPERQELKTLPHSIQGDIDYTAPIYYNHLVEVNNNYDKYDLGDYITVCRNVLLKGESVNNNSQHIETFAQAIILATTDESDPVALGNIMANLDNIRRNSKMLKNSQTEIEFITADNSSAAAGLYKDFMKMMNDENSKAIAGGTMITDDGSSKSQSDNHMLNAMSRTKSDISFIETIIKNELIPVLKNLNLITTKGIKYNFNEPEIQTIEQKVDVDRFLIENFKVKDINYFIKRYGTELEYLDEIEEDEEVESFKQELKLAKKKSDRYDINLSLTDV